MHTPNLCDSRTTEYTFESADVGTDLPKTEGRVKSEHHIVTAIHVHCVVTDEHSKNLLVDPASLDRTKGEADKTSYRKHIIGPHPGLT